ncbi:hypothetical protein [Streptomyces europaeiscabiei]|uniref:hypothetical protein n=1 Tax=Streptomyces europaeiscabiei TaxID=146819 RepID=UPI0038F69E2D
MPERGRLIVDGGFPVGWASSWAKPSVKVKAKARTSAQIALDRAVSTTAEP